MKKLLMLVALFGFCVGCGAEPANDQGAELENMEGAYENPEADAASSEEGGSDGSDKKPGSDSK
ncbi:MAG: hypothetical protein AAGG44_11420 [Planctomycetota bacterium]